MLSGGARGGEQALGRTVFSAARVTIMAWWMGTFHAAGRVVLFCGWNTTWAPAACRQAPVRQARGCVAGTAGQDGGGVGGSATHHASLRRAGEAEALEADHHPDAHAVERESSEGEDAQESKTNRSLCKMKQTRAN